MPKLKPCPFCGGKAEFFVANLRTGKGYYVCENHCCEQFFVMSKEEATEAWNRRAEDGSKT